MLFGCSPLCVMQILCKKIPQKLLVVSWRSFEGRSVACACRRPADPSTDLPLSPVAPPGGPPSERVWGGHVYIQDMLQFGTVAYRVSGYTVHLQKVRQSPPRGLTKLRRRSRIINQSINQSIEQYLLFRARLLLHNIKRFSIILE